MHKPLALALILTATQAAAWEFTPYPTCNLTHTEPAATITLTKDLTKPLPYTIAITRPSPWPAAPSFSIEFQGPAPLTIGTDRHALSDQNTTLSVSDTGFGNVLAGLKYNTSATARSGQTTVDVSLEGAADPLAAFEACPTAATS